MSLAGWFRKPGTNEFVRPMYDSPEDVPSPKPRLASVRAAPSREDFAAWRDQPVTQFVMAGLARNAEECREQWQAASWGTGKADQMVLTGLRERADGIMGLVEADYEAWCQTLGVEPEATDA